MQISVIIPCYNCEKYIASTITSVLNQTYKEVEIICVDNGSTDATVLILTNLSAIHDQITLLHQPQKGAPKARNMGLQFAKGEVIQFLDSDDLIAPDKLEMQIDIIQNQGLDIVVSDRSVYNESMKELIAKYTFEKIETDPLATSISEIIITGNPLYLKSALLSIDGWDESLESAQDWDLHIRMALQKLKFGYLPGDFLYSRSHINSLSANWLNVSKNCDKVLEKLQLQIMSSNSYNNLQVKKKIFYCYFDLAIYTDDSEIYLEKLKSWMVYDNAHQFLTGVNKIFATLFGIKTTIKLKSWFNKKFKPD